MRLYLDGIMRGRKDGRTRLREQLRGARLAEKDWEARDWLGMAENSWEKPSGARLAEND